NRRRDGARLAGEELQVASMLLPRSRFLFAKSENPESWCKRPRSAEPHHATNHQYQASCASKVAKRRAANRDRAPARCGILLKEEVPAKVIAVLRIPRLEPDRSLQAREVGSF